MNKLKCLIIDDDQLITDLVVHFAQKSDSIEFCVSCNDPVEGLKLLSNSNFDVLFLDYNMPLLNGKDLLEIKKDSSKVIMVTSNSEFAVDSYEYENIIDYLVKPLNYKRFEKAIQKVLIQDEVKKNIRPNIDQKSILIKDGSNWIPLLFDNILFIKSDSNYCTFHTINKKVMSLAKLKELEIKLPSNFIRCHRSYIINVDFINRINLEEIEIQRSIIPVSSLYKNQIKEFLDSKK
ncbi:MAG: LytTR family DNA-binding domain-containing protein [Vicingaceae bacterium]